MEPKLLKTAHAEYQQVEYTGENTSGVQPIGDRVMILPDIAAEQTTGGIYIDQVTRERQTMAAESGIVVAMGSGAFLWNADRTRPFHGESPDLGDRVFFERYAGQPLLGNDGKQYRMMDDKCIAGIEHLSNKQEKE